MSQASNLEILWKKFRLNTDPIINFVFFSQLSINNNGKSKTVDFV